MRRRNITLFRRVLIGCRATVGRVWTSVCNGGVLLQSQNVLVGDLLEGLWFDRTGIGVEGFQVGRCSERVHGALVVDNLLSYLVCEG